MNRLQEEYKKRIVGELMKEHNLTNVMEVPTLRKIVVNVGAGEAVENKGALEEIVEIVTKITGQKPVVNKAKKAVSAFKIREGMEIGVSATLRGDRMWQFFDKLINVVLPRTKDFRGLSPKSFDGSGNYSLGIEDHTVFIEIDPNNVTKIRSLEVTIVTTAKDDEGGKALLDKFGFPFIKNVKRS
ncbi:50S ribosomal protein L5 [Candidatus Dojkabacteria bacterium]|jgi:large subunit ribosomal protein L5|nr:50S ribosomal protein L5 [Candidatus Dojkabacteria bacterium]